MNMTALLPSDITDSKAMKIGYIIDHLVDALGAEPGCTLRRAVILADIDEFKGTTPAAIIERLGVDKSTLNRDIEWLYDYGCIMRQKSFDDKRAITLHICGYSKKNLDLTLKYFENSHKSLKNFLIELINLFGTHKPTLRDAKIVSSLGDGQNVSKKGIFESLYNGPSTTDNRAMNNLVDLEIVRKQSKDDV